MEQQNIFLRKNCPICGNSSFPTLFNCKDFTVSGESFPVVRCTCGFTFTNPVPAQSVIGQYYQSQDYISHSSTKKGLVAKLYHLVRRYTLRKKLALIARLAKKGRLLDIGCGTGNFLSVCRSAGWGVTGVEPDAGARTQIEKDIPVYGSVGEISGGGSFDVITMWHVLEHLPDFPEVLSFCGANLNDGGALVIAVPNHRSFDAKHYGPLWAAFDVPRHLSHFDRESIARIAKKTGFRVERVLPMKFDSFYVSLLSEKYRGSGILGMARAFLIGLISNFRASRSGEYSSLIYLLRKA